MPLYTRLLIALLYAAVPATLSAQTAPPAAPEKALLDRLVNELQCQPGQKCDPAIAALRSRGLAAAPSEARPNPKSESGRRILELAAKSRSLPTSDVEVYFPYNSATLVPETRRLLDTMAQALKTEQLAKSDFALIGHTDARGGESFNQSLSERRAAAVRAYLAGTGGVASTRLATWGRGKTELKKAEEPFADVNRRVQLINVGAKSTPDATPPDAAGSAAPRPKATNQSPPPQGNPEGCRQYDPRANTTTNCN